jgi:hypothetical protein
VPSDRPAPLAAATPVTDGVYRDGKLLVVRRGADVSDRCAKCGRPAAGTAYVRRLGDVGGTGGHFDGGDVGDGVAALIVLAIGLFVLLVWLLSLLLDLADRRERTVVVGLCDEHQQLRRYVRRAAVVGWLVVPVALAVGILDAVRPPHAAAACVTIGVACGLAAVAGLILGVVARGYPNVRLAREDKGWMWVSGFAAALLAGQTPWPKLPTPPKRDVHAGPA